MIRPECEQHYTPARDNQYRATARYYKDSCPYCEIDRLKGELEEARADLHRAVSANSLYNQQASNLEHQLEEANNTIIAHANTISRVEAANVHLQDQLAKAKKEAQNYKNVLIGQGFENLDALAYETRDATQIGAIAKQRTEQIIAQLAEARAEIERLNSVDHYACALCPDVAQARQEAAREIIELMGGWSLQNSTLITCRGIVARHFGLEG